MNPLEICKISKTKKLISLIKKRNPLLHPHVASVEPSWLITIHFQKMYIQGVLWNIMGCIMKLKCGFCSPDKGAFYTYAYIIQTHFMYNITVHTHTHTHIYIYTYICKFMYVYAPTLEVVAHTVFMGLATGLLCILTFRSLLVVNSHKSNFMGILSISLLFVCHQSFHLFQVLQPMLLLLKR